MASENITAGPNGQEELARLQAQPNYFDLLRLKQWLKVVTNQAPLANQFLAHCMTHGPLGHGQLMQDLFVDFVLAKEGGCFVEFGATNGVDLSNTLFLERHRGWTGVLAEPAKGWHEALMQNRKACKIDRRCVWKDSRSALIFRETREGAFSTIDRYSGLDLHRDRRRIGRQYEVETVSLNELLATHIPSERVDYLSVDTEGSELDILSTFDFDRYQPRIITVEHNFTAQRQGILELLVQNGYTRIFKDLSFVDDWYVNRETRCQLEERFGRPISKLA